MKTRITDRASGTGVYEGDLKFGRCNGNVISKHGDVDARREDGVSTNQPVAPLVLVQQRDPKLWRRDTRVKEVKKTVDNSQHGVNYVLKAFREHQHNLRMDVHLVVGRQRW